MDSRILLIEDEPASIQALSAILKEQGYQISVADRLPVSDAVFERLQDRFEFEPRGTIELKGRGPMKTNFLIAPKT